MAVFDCVADGAGLVGLATDRMHLTFLLGDNVRYRILFGFMAIVVLSSAGYLLTRREREPTGAPATMEA